MPIGYRFVRSSRRVLLKEFSFTRDKKYKRKEKSFPDLNWLMLHCSCANSCVTFFFCQTTVVETTVQLVHQLRVIQIPDRFLRATEKSTCLKPVSAAVETVTSRGPSPGIAKPRCSYGTDSQWARQASVNPSEWMNKTGARVHRFFRRNISCSREPGRNPKGTEIKVLLNPACSGRPGGR